MKELSLTLKPQQPVRAKITSVGAYVPPKLLTNHDLEQMVATNDQWIQERTGIRERHIVDARRGDQRPRGRSRKACLEKRGIPATDVEVIIVATVTPDMLFPATACLVQDKLGAKGAWGFDLSAACSGFPYALQVGAKLVESGAHKKVMVIGADVMSSIIDYTDRATCVIFGDGAGAVLLEPCDGDEVGMIDYWHEIDGSGAAIAEHACRRHHCIPQQPRPWRPRCTLSTRMAARCTSSPCARWPRPPKTVLTRNGITGADLGCFIPHQANKRIILSTAERLGMPEERVIINIDRFGNTTAATIPMAMQTALDEGRLKKGDLVLLASFGAGFTVGATLLRWEF